MVPDDYDERVPHLLLFVVTSFFPSKKLLLLCGLSLLFFGYCCAPHSSYYQVNDYTAIVPERVDRNFRLPLHAVFLV